MLCHVLALFAMVSHFMVCCVHKEKISKPDDGISDSHYIIYIIYIVKTKSNIWIKFVREQSVCQQWWTGLAESSNVNFFDIGENVLEFLR